MLNLVKRKYEKVLKWNGLEHTLPLNWEAESFYWKKHPTSFLYRALEDPNASPSIWTTHSSDLSRSQVLATFHGVENIWFASKPKINKHFAGHCPAIRSFNISHSTTIHMLLVCRWRQLASYSITNKKGHVYICTQLDTMPAFVYIDTIWTGCFVEKETNYSMRKGFWTYRGLNYLGFNSWSTCKRKVLKNGFIKSMLLMLATAVATEYDW